MTPLEILEKGRDRIADPARWFKGAFADRSHRPAVPDDVLFADCRVCAWGAINWAACGDPYDTGLNGAAASEAYNLLGGAIRSREGTKAGRFVSVPGFNDRPTTTHEDILAVFDAAIEKAKAELVTA